MEYKKLLVCLVPQHLSKGSRLAGCSTTGLLASFHIVVSIVVSKVLSLSLFALLWGMEGRQSLPPALLSSPIPSC